MSGGVEFCHRRIERVCRFPLAGCALRLSVMGARVSLGIASHLSFLPSEELIIQKLVASLQEVDRELGRQVSTPQILHAETGHGGAPAPSPETWVLSLLLSDLGHVP